MQSLNGGPDPEKLQEAIQHMNLSIEFCRAQQKAGRLFLIEQPAYASSWKLPSLDGLRNEHFTHEGFLHMCQYGLTAIDDCGREGPVLKPTRIPYFEFMYT